MAEPSTEENAKFFPKRYFLRHPTAQTEISGGNAIRERIDIGH